MYVTINYNMYTICNVIRQGPNQYPSCTFTNTRTCLGHCTPESFVLPGQRKKGDMCLFSKCWRLVLAKGIDLAQRIQPVGDLQDV